MFTDVTLLLTFFNSATNDMTSLLNPRCARVLTQSRSLSRTAAAATCCSSQRVRLGPARSGSVAAVRRAASVRPSEGEQKHVTRSGNGRRGGRGHVTYAELRPLRPHEVNKQTVYCVLLLQTDPERHSNAVLITVLRSILSTWFSWAVLVI